MANILIADNDITVQGFMVKTLEAAGHQITAASDGLEALGKIYAGSFDLAILGVALPYVGGAGLLDVIRKRSPRTMVVMVSDQANLDSITEALRNGAFDFIKKPLEKNDFEKIVQKALEEGRLMRSSGYVYKDRRRLDKSLIKNGILYAISDSLLAGFSICLAFLGQIHLFRMLDRPLFMGQIEFIQMGLGLAFCYAFMFVFKRCHRVDLLGSRLELIGQIWRNVTGAYLLFAAILFLAKDMNLAASRIAIGTGYILGFLLILTNRIIVIPGAITRFRREGKKNIVIVSSGKPAARIRQRAPRQAERRAIVEYVNREHPAMDGIGPNASVIASREDADRVALTDDVEDLYIAGDAFSAAEVLSLLDRFRGRKLKVVVLGRTGEAMKQTKIPEK